MLILSEYLQKKNSLYRSLLFYVKILEHHLLQINTKNAATFCAIIKFRYLIICFVLLLRALFRTIRQSGDFCTLAAAFALEFVYVNNLCCCCVNDDDDLV